MSSSDRPTDPAPRRPRSWFPEARKFIDGVKWAGSTLASAGAALFAANAWIQNHVTEQELEQRLKPVDANVEALLARVIAQEEQLRAQGAALQEQRQRAEQLRLELFENYWVDVGVRAAELERDKRKADKAADEARERFEAYYRAGLPMQEALRKALRRGLP